LDGRSALSFSELVSQMVMGEIPLNMETILEQIWQGILSQMEAGRKSMTRILALVILAAVFCHVAELFPGSQVSQISFYLMYLSLVTLLLQSFLSFWQVAERALEQVLTFMKLLIPSFFLASVLASGSISGTGFQELTFGVLLLVQWIVKEVILPAVWLYVLLAMMNHMMREAFFSRLAELVKLGVGWSLKTVTTLALGMQTIQCLILPAVDEWRGSFFRRTAGALPGVGNLFRGVAETVMGAGLVIRNSIGAAGLLFLVLLCLVPLGKLAFGSFFYQLLAALSQPVTDTRMSACVAVLGEGVGLLLKILFTVGTLFFVSVAMATAAFGG
jgi:stage III sporulation protein AE